MAGLDCEGYNGRLGNGLVSAWLCHWLGWACKSFGLDSVGLGWELSWAGPGLPMGLAVLGHGMVCAGLSPGLGCAVGLAGLSLGLANGLARLFHGLV